MAQPHNPEQHPETFGAGRLIEKGWTVYDALEHPIGTVTDVDSARSVLTVDGRPVGLGTFEVPLDLVSRSGGNEVYLTKVIEPGSLGETESLRMVDPPAPTPIPASTTARARGRARTGAASEGAAMTGAEDTSTSRPTMTMAGQSIPDADPTPSRPFSQFTPPYATQAAETPASYSDPEWGGGDHSNGWGAKKIGMAALAFGGLAAAGYVMRRRARRKTPYERFMASASDYLGLASGYASGASDLASAFAAEIARQKNPAWLAGLAAAAAVPIAYYAWPSTQPTYREQASAQADGMTSALGEYWQSLSGRMSGSASSGRDLSGQMRRLMPSATTFEVPSNWRIPSAWNRSSDWSMPGDWSMKPDVALPIGLLAVSALALYLARRAMVKPKLNARIGDIMTRKPRVIQPDATVADAAAIMRRLDVGALPVCDGSRLIGMVTDRDITTRSTAEGRDPHLTPVRDVMSPGVAWATEDDLVEEAARIMREHRIRRLPIVDERHSLVGVVSLGDLATEVGNDEVSGDTLESISE